MVVCTFGSSLLMTYAVSMAIHMRRIEGRFPALAMVRSEWFCRLRAETTARRG
jgi:hypothetical protein